MEGFDQENRVIFSGRNLIKAMTIDGKEVVVKRFKRPDILQKVIYTFFRHTKAYKAYHNALTLLDRGIMTPYPVCFEETKRLGFVDYCYYVCEHDDNPPIEDLTDRDDWSRPLALSFAHFVAELHEKGVLDHDLNDTNVRYSQDGHTFHFSLIDINRMQFYSVGTPIPLKVCLDNLTRFTGRLDLFEFVVREYARVRKFDEESTARLALQIKNAHDRNWYRRKRFTGRLKKLVGRA